MKKHEIISVVNGSIAQEIGLETGDCLLALNGQEVGHILDYRWLMAEEMLLVEAEKPDGEVWEIEIEKDSGEDLGLTFAPGSMGEDRRCVNACVFCFVDQQPPGLRESLYVKDDDFYQSFALGNYITLTNLEDGDIQRIIKYRLSPLRISVHAGDMSLRCMMMRTVRAGYLFKLLERFCDAGIDMHFQVVLCKGINDGGQLDTTIERLLPLGDRARSLAVVPVGLTRFRDGLYPLTAFTAEDAADVIAQVEGWQRQLCEKLGRRFVFLADEWYVLAGRSLPGYDVYEDFPQLDNGVGMMALFREGFLRRAMGEISCGFEMEVSAGVSKGSNSVQVGIVTGQAAGVFMSELLRCFVGFFPNISSRIHVIANDFYGPGVTVSGLITGCDIIKQLEGHCQGLDVLFVPGNAFRAGSDEMLCGATLDELAKVLGVSVVKGSGDGGEFCGQLLGLVGLV